MMVNVFLKTLLLLGVLFILPTSGYAAIDNAGILDTVLNQYYIAASSWAAIITEHATRLFWNLVVISMVWTFGFMALRRADLGEFFAEFIKFTILTGLFWWLLTNGPDYADTIIVSMRQMGGEAIGTGDALSPSGIVDIGFEIFERVLVESTVWKPINSILGTVIAIIILVILALVAVNMLLLLISVWILAYAGIFYLGFGGSRWTSDIAINYFKTVLGIAMQLFTMVLIIGIGESILLDYYLNLSSKIEFGEMVVVLVVAVILLNLVNKLPPLIASVITGAHFSSNIGSTGAGTALAIAGAAAAAAAMGVSVVKEMATQVSETIEKIRDSSNDNTQENPSSNNDLLSSEPSANQNDDFSSSGHSNESENTPLSSAAGFLSSDSTFSGDNDSMADSENELNEETEHNN